MNNEYRRDPRGFLVRITPKTFRRGRIHWEGGYSRTEQVDSGGKKHLIISRSKWVGNAMHDPARVKCHSKKA